MSDAIGEHEFWGRQLLRKSQLNPLRSKMEEFVNRTEPLAGPKEIRDQLAPGTDLSTLVDEGREERV